MVKKGDFISIDFVGYIKDTNAIFDTTLEKVAKEHLHAHGKKFEPAIICLGQHFVFPKIENELDGKEPGKYEIELKTEEAFGKKKPGMMKTVNTNIFLKNKIRPHPGLQVTLDETLGTIRTVNGGRTTVDFNHPLAGKELRYEITINNVVTDVETKLRAILSHLTHLPKPTFKIKLGDKVTVELAVAMPEEIAKQLIAKIKELIPEIKELEFTKGALK